MTKRGLGKGLGALIPGSELSAYGELLTIPLSSIYPSSIQPREEFSDDNLMELMTSIKEQGVIEPILVRPQQEGYEIIAGERRWRAAQLAGLKEIPALVKDLDDSQSLEISLVENLQREDLNPLEVAKAIKGLIEKFHLTQEEVGQKIGKSRSEVSNLLRLLQLPPQAQKNLREGEISYGQARALLSLKSEEEILQAMKRMREKKLSVREAERLVKAQKSLPAADGLSLQEKERIKNELQLVLGSKVRLEEGKAGGKIVIEYDSFSDLKRIFQVICRGLDVSRET